jgi:phosphoribosylformylglycinamidine cyclo-ligase
LQNSEWEWGAKKAMADAYREAGVDIAAGNEAVERMKKHVTRTMRPEVIADLGGFGGLFALANKYEEPVLVSGTDGVGTKLMIAFQMDRHDTIGIDAVAMCVNDIVVQGAEPLFFLDYLACGKLSPAKVETIVSGIAEGCVQAGCALIGGETAEMPGMYKEDEYDIAGFAVGVVERRELLDGSAIREGDAIIGIASSGLHSNGFSLVRKILLADAGYRLDERIAELGEQPLGEVLLTPTKIYVKTAMALRKAVDVKGFSHITGGGLLENIPRVLPNGFNADLIRGSWPIPPIFELLKSVGKLSEREMCRTFNMGVGLVAFVPEEQVELAIETARQAGEQAYRIGTVTRGEGKVTLDGEEPV